MSKQARLDVAISIMGSEQHAKVLPNTTPSELIESILQEFREFDYLGMAVNNYAILNTSDKQQLDPQVALEKQVNARQPINLLLLEHIAPTPAGATKIKKRVYLRESPRERVYKLQWTPAPIGRPSSDPSVTDNGLIAVDLASHDNGLRVSRRQARISEDANGVYIENLGSNPTTLISKNGEQTLDQKRHKLQHGDIIKLDRSGIMLKVIIRDEQ